MLWFRFLMRFPLTVLWTFLCPQTSLHCRTIRSVRIPTLLRRGDRCRKARPVRGMVDCGEEGGYVVMASSRRPLTIAVEAECILALEPAR